MRSVLIAAALALTACNVAEQQEAAPAERQVAATPSGACGTSAASTWSDLTIEAVTAGDDCARASATITIRNASRASLLAETYTSNDLMVLAGAQSKEDVQRMLAEWITPAGAMADSTGDLPEWAEREGNPMSGEFPFYVEGGIDRAAYAALRTRDAPLYCYVQGLESLACLVYENGALTKVGLQTFPG